MEQDLRKGLLVICRSLQHWKVRYLFVGGTAVALHGYYRHSMGPNGQLTTKPDIDIWFDPTYENYFNLLNMLKDLDLDVTEFLNEQHPDPKHAYFKLDMGEFTMDVLPRIQADIPFADAYTRKEAVDLDGVPIHYIGFEDLLDDKQRSARKKDQADIEQLKRQQGKG